MGCHFLLQGIFPNRGIEPGSLALHADSLPTELPGKPKSLRGQWAYFLPGVTVRMCSGVGPEGWEGRLRCFDYPSGGVECRGHAQYSAFAPNTQFCFQLFRGSSWVSWYLYSFWVQSLPQVATHSFIFSPLLFLCILLLKERCDQIQTLQHRNKGSQVPACLKRTSRRHKSRPQARPGETRLGRGSAGGCKPSWGCEERKVWPILMLSRAPILASRVEWLE